jgi:hypothetical protein
LIEFDKCRFRMFPHTEGSTNRFVYRRCTLLSQMGWRGHFFRRCPPCRWNFVGSSHGRPF